MYAQVPGHHTESTKETGCPALSLSHFLGARLAAENPSHPPVSTPYSTGVTDAGAATPIILCALEIYLNSGPHVGPVKCSTH